MTFYNNKMTDLKPFIIEENNKRILDCSLLNNYNRLSCIIEGLDEIRNLPENLRDFICDYNSISKIENLPENLRSFCCYSNKISKIENLPDNLQIFICTCNNISKIENLPDSLLDFYCGCNNISVIENLPQNLEDFIYYENPIKYIDNISIDDLQNTYNVEFDLKWYNSFKKLQRTLKYKIININTINYYLHDWVWKPKCDDNTLGINLRIGLKENLDFLIKKSV